MAKYGTTFKYGNNNSYGIRTRIFQTETYIWNLAAAVVKTLTLKWDLIGVAIRTFTLKWNLKVGFEKTSTFVWNLLSSMGLWTSRSDQSSSGWSSRPTNP